MTQVTSESLGRKQEVLLDLGTYRSDALLVVSWAKLNQQFPKFFARLRKRESHDNNNKELLVGPVPSFESGWQICAAIAETYKQPCQPVLAMRR